MTDFFPPICTTAFTRYCFVFLLLMVYSVLGWCGEMVYCSLGQRKLCEKRGFLNGTVCPIYGHGALVVLLCLDGGCKNPVLTFLLGAVLTSIVEYATSFAMEKLFHMRWWDYSKHKFNINGRVCLLNSTLFGLASVFLCHLANPPIADWLTDLFVKGVAIPLAIVLTVVYLTDIILSVRSAIQIGSRLAKLHAIHDELSEKLEELKREQQQAIEARRQRLETARESVLQNAEQKLEELKGLKEEPFFQHLEAAKEAARRSAEEKLHALYARQDFFERRMLHSFPTMKSPRHPEALTKLKEYLRNRKK